MKLFILSALLLLSVGCTDIVSAFNIPSVRVVSRSAFGVCDAQRSKYSSCSKVADLGHKADFKSKCSLQSTCRAGLFGRKRHQHNFQIHYKLATFVTVSMKKFKRILTITLASAILSLGPLSHSPLTSRPVAHASTVPAKVQNRQEARLDKMIDNYVQKHMFDDDQFDPLESTYREIITDSKSRAYPNALSSIASNLGATQTAATSESTEKNVSNDGIMKAMLKLVNSLEDKYNIPRSILVPVLALACFGIPSFVIGMVALSFSFAQRGMTERMAIERYGESVLDAEEVAEEEEDDDDYDYESGEYDDDDDDDDDDDEVSKVKLLCRLVESIF